MLVAKNRMLQCNGEWRKTNKRTKNATDNDNNDNDSVGDEIKQFISS